MILRPIPVHNVTRHIQKHTSNIRVARPVVIQSVIVRGTGIGRKRGGRGCTGQVARGIMYVELLIVRGRACEVEGARR